MQLPTSSAPKISFRALLFWFVVIVGFVAWSEGAGPAGAFVVDTAELAGAIIGALFQFFGAFTEALDAANG